MSFYSELKDTASELLAEFGQAVTLRNVAAGAYDPATGTSTPVVTDAVRKGAIFDFAQGETLGPGGLIQAGDKKLLLEAGVIPTLEDLVVIGTVEYAIKGIGETNPAGTPVMYTLHLRRG